MSLVNREACGERVPSPPSVEVSGWLVPSEEVSRAGDVFCCSGPLSSALNRTNDTLSPLALFCHRGSCFSVLTLVCKLETHQPQGELLQDLDLFMVPVAWGAFLPRPGVAFLDVPPHAIKLGLAFSGMCYEKLREVDS